MQYDEIANDTSINYYQYRYERFNDRGYMVMSILTVGDDSFVVDLDEPFVSFLERLSIVSQKD